MSQAIPAFTPPPPSYPYQGPPQQQISAALASSLSGMGGDSIAPVAIVGGVIAGGLLTAAVATLAVRGDKPQPLQARSLKSIERPHTPQLESVPTSSKETPPSQPVPLSRSVQPRHQSTRQSRSVSSHRLAPPPLPPPPPRQPTPSPQFPLEPASASTAGTMLRRLTPLLRMKHAQNQPPGDVNPERLPLSPPQRESTPVLTEEIPPPQSALSLLPALPEKMPESSSPKTMLTSLSTELLQKIFSFAWENQGDNQNVLSIRKVVENRRDKAAVKLVNRQIAEAVCGYERPMCLKYIGQLRKNSEYPHGYDWPKIDEELVKHGTLILCLRDKIVDNIPYFIGDEDEDGKIESGMSDLVDLVIELNFRHKLGVDDLRKDLAEISIKLEMMKYNNEFVSKKMYLHDLSIFVNCIQNTWSDRYLNIFRYIDYVRPITLINGSAAHYLMGISPKNHHTAIKRFILHPEDPNAQDLEVVINIAKELVDRIPGHFTATEKSDALDRLEDVFKTYYNEIDHAPDDKTTWEDNEFGASLRRARATIKPL